MVTTPHSDIRHDWTRDEAQALMARPLLDLVFEAATVHRRHHRADEVQLSTLLSIKTGGCPEDCSYCPQSARFKTAVENEPLLDIAAVKASAKAAKDAGSSRFCMGAAWRSPPSETRFKEVLDMVEEVKAMGLETCATLGMVNTDQARRLKEAGLDYYNHNLDTSPEFYGEIITTRTYEDRLKTIEAVREAGMSVCCGGILGLGEDDSDRAGLLTTLATLTPHPESVPINTLVAVEGTPLGDSQAKNGAGATVDELDWIRVIAAARIMMPKAYVRLSAGRTELSDGAHALAFLAGANSIFAGDRLLTTPNPGEDHDLSLLSRLGLKPSSIQGDEHPASRGRGEAGCALTSAQGQLEAEGIQTPA